MPTTAAENALAAMRASVFGTDPMAPPAPVEPTIAAPSDPGAAVNASPGGNPTDLSDFIEIAGLLVYDPAAITRIYAGSYTDRKSTRLNSSHVALSRMPSSA